MRYLKADYIVTCNDKFTIIKDGGIVFDDKIIAVDSYENLQNIYKEEFVYMGKNSVLMPGLINSHIHLEFSGNKTTLHYGNFVKWLFSVIANREAVIEKATSKVIKKELDDMLKSGITTIGAISSYGFDMQNCIDAKQTVVYFTEVLGSKPEMIDTLFLDFKEKLNSALSVKSDKFIPAIAIHSPYSTHPFLIREVLKIAKDKHLAVSAHFQESVAENDWLNNSSGEFEQFFSDILNQHKSMTNPSDFLYQFKGLENLSFTHCVQANEKELKQIKDLKGAIIHCPNSNRLLNNSSLNLNYLNDIPLAIGTDGLSSNHSLNLFEELRSALYIHTNLEPNQLAQKLLLSATNGGGVTLGLKKGILKKDYDADLISFCLPDICENLDTLAIHIILHNSKINKLYIKGEDELF